MFPLLRWSLEYKNFNTFPMMKSLFRKVKKNNDFSDFLIFFQFLQIHCMFTIISIIPSVLSLKNSQNCEVFNISWLTWHDVIPCHFFCTKAHCAKGATSPWLQSIVISVRTWTKQKCRQITIIVVIDYRQRTRNRYCWCQCTINSYGANADVGWRVPTVSTKR